MDLPTDDFFCLDIYYMVSPYHEPNGKKPSRKEAFVHQKWTSPSCPMANRVGGVNKVGLYDFQA